MTVLDCAATASAVVLVVAVRRRFYQLRDQDIPVSPFIPMAGVAAVTVLAAVVGLANVVFVVPSQTIFQQRTPAEMLGRIVAIRLALVNAMLAVSMVTSGLFAQIFGLDAVLAGCGILATAAGLTGLTVRAIREA